MEENAVVFVNNVKLRPYQIYAKEKIFEAWKHYDSVMLQMPTGTGKTILFSSIIRDIHNIGVSNKKAIRILVLAHRQELIEQIAESLGRKYGIAHGIIKSGYVEQMFYPNQIASVQTLSKRLKKWEEKDFDFIIIDEAHHALAKTYIKIIKAFPNAKILGVTATPYRLNRQPFTNLFNTLILSKSIKSFIDDGYLCDYKYFSIRPNSLMQKAIDSIDDFDIEGDYSNSAMMQVCDNDKIRADIFETYLKYAKGKKGIVYTINKQHNINLANKFRKNGIKVELIDSDTKTENRKDVVTKFRRGEIDVLFNVNIFNEGFDCPDVEFIQLARPTMSLSLYLQQVGRGFRIHENKKEVLFLDNVGLYNKFGLPSANRKWEYHFKGDKNWKKENDFTIDKNDNHQVDYIDIFEGNESTELIYSSIENDIKDKEEIIDSSIDEIILTSSEIDLNNILKERNQDVEDLKLANNYFLGVDRDIDYNKAFQIYEKLSNTFDEAKYKLAISYLNGYGIRKDISKGIALLTEVANNGYVEAQEKLGYFYYNGIWVNVDYKKALALFRKAIKQKSITAQTYLAIAYIEGNGVEVNHDKAVELLIKPSDKGDKLAKIKLEELYAEKIKIKSEQRKQEKLRLKKIQDEIDRKELIYKRRIENLEKARKIKEEKRRNEEALNNYYNNVEYKYPNNSSPSLSSPKTSIRINNNTLKSHQRILLKNNESQKEKKGIVEKIKTFFRRIRRRK
ncbi:MAG: DEAD/DEAH box helicase family protein [Bacteroidales bacterium]|nr:DEAD/DEAH box helicase family protein [Bacteroidales bacterium]MDD4529811.1 DEAD/DEAH box helicase family protein [Bacteroidales bacterium]